MEGFSVISRDNGCPMPPAAPSTVTLVNYEEKISNCPRYWFETVTILIPVLRRQKKLVVGKRQKFVVMQSSRRCTWNNFEELRGMKN